jgi:hypothetical protein
MMVMDVVTIHVSGVVPLGFPIRWPIEVSTTDTAAPVIAFSLCGMHRLLHVVQLESDGDGQLHRSRRSRRGW